jgi:hypothetical protein
MQIERGRLQTLRTMPNKLTLTKAKSSLARGEQVNAAIYPLQTKPRYPVKETL